MSSESKQSNRTRKKRYALLCVFGTLAFVVIAFLIHYRGVRLIVNKEYGTAPSAADFTSRAAMLETDEKPTCGWHALNLKIGGFPTLVFLHVTDTLAPTAEPVPKTVPVGSAPGPDTFIRSVKDADRVRVTFEQTPDFSVEWDGTVRIVLEDGAGNRTTVPVAVSVRATVPSLTLEAGEEPPQPERFLIKGVKAEPETPITAEMMHHVGDYPIRFVTDRGVRSETVLHVVDNVAPQARGTMVQLAPDETAEPETFVLDEHDETDLRFTFVQTPDYTRRDVQKVIVRLTDEGGNTLDVESELFITGVQPRVVEARRTALTQDDFDNRQGQTIAMDPFIPDTPGTYALDVSINGVSETVVVTVVDTTPPAVKEKSLDGVTLYTHCGYLPEDFFEASDISSVTLTFAPGTDLDTVGEREIGVIARDAYGNETLAKRTVTLSEDLNPPHLYGVINRICYVGEPIAYLSEVFSEDDEDGRLEVEVESEVLLHQEGVYNVVYRAKDRSGNVTEQSCTYTLIQRTVTDEELHAMAKSIMDEITTPDMVDAEKLKAIFFYVKGHIKYANGSNNNYTDWRKAAYDGYMKGTGDCYNIYSLTRALLDETDIPYLSVERVKTYVRRTRHYWVHVNLGTGWYVFDPTWTPKHRIECFMWTKEQCSSCRLYWHYKEDEYPPLATERFDYDAVVEMERNGLLP